jgi:hypothetical protein
MKLLYDLLSRIQAKRQLRLRLRSISVGLALRLITEPAARGGKSKDGLLSPIAIRPSLPWTSTAA